MNATLKQGAWAHGNAATNSALARQEHAGNGGLEPKGCRFHGRKKPLWLCREESKVKKVGDQWEVGLGLTLTPSV
jgi:hypothetical protein